MLSLSAAEAVRRILAIGCHSDDIEIGCGGTLLTLTRRIRISRSTGSCWQHRASVARKPARGAEGVHGRGLAARVEVHAFRDGFLPYVGGEVKGVFENIKGRVDTQIGS